MRTELPFFQEIFLDSFGRNVTGVTLLIRTGSLPTPRPYPNQGLESQEPCADSGMGLGSWESLQAGEKLGSWEPCVGCFPATVSPRPLDKVQRLPPPAGPFVPPPGPIVLPPLSPLIFCEGEAWLLATEMGRCPAQGAWLLPNSPGCCQQV